MNISKYVGSTWIIWLIEQQNIVNELKNNTNGMTMNQFRSFNFFVSIKSLKNFTCFCEKYLYYKKSVWGIKYEGWGC